MADLVVHAAHQQPSGFTAGLLALDPGDLIPSDVLGGVALRANQLAICEPACAVQSAHLVTYLAQEVVHYTDATLVHARQRQKQLPRPFGLQTTPMA